DHAIAASDEVIAPVAQLDHVAGVDEALAVGEHGRAVADVAERRATGADTQRAVLDLELDAARQAADQARREASASVVDVEADARLGRRIGVTDARLRIGR